MRASLSTPFSIAFLFAGQLTANAQSYVSAPNTVGATAAYTQNRSKGTYSFCGNEYETCLSDFSYTTHMATFGGEYSTPVQGLALTVNLAAIDPNTTGATRPGMELADEGLKLTDLRGDVRYLLPMQPGGVRITPQVGFTYPFDYPVPPGLHANYGQKLKMVHLGVNVGRAITDKLFFESNVFLTLTELPDDRPFGDPTLPTLEEAGVKAPHRSDAALDLGYFVLPQLNLQLGTAARWTFGGWDFKEFAMWDPDPMNWTPDQLTTIVHHDQVPKTKYVILHGGASYQFFEGLSMYGDVARMMVGASVEKLTFAFTFGVAGDYTF